MKLDPHYAMFGGGPDDFDVPCGACGWDECPWCGETEKPMIELENGAKVILWVGNAECGVVLADFGDAYAVWYSPGIDAASGKAFCVHGDYFKKAPHSLDDARNRFWDRANENGFAQARM